LIAGAAAQTAVRQLGRWLDPNGRNRVRRETGKEWVVQVHYDEGIAIHIGAE
jgi:hypothetical protein